MAADERWACDGCGTVLHGECAGSLDRCPALGCPGLPPGRLAEGRVSWARLVADAGPWLEMGDALRASDAWGPPGAAPFDAAEDEDPSGSSG